MSNLVYMFTFGFKLMFFLVPLTPLLHKGTVLYCQRLQSGYYLPSLVTPGLRPASPSVPGGNRLSSQMRLRSHWGARNMNRYARHTRSTGSSSSLLSVSPSLLSMSWELRWERLMPLLWPIFSTSCNTSSSQITDVHFWFLLPCYTLYVNTVICLIIKRTNVRRSYNY